MRVEATPLDGVLLVETRVFQDERGFFRESWRAGRYAELGIGADFVQDNVSYSTAGVLRGLHFQWPHPQGKLVSVLRGEVWDVAVDVRAGSPTFGRWAGYTLSAENGRQLWIPEGFAHGFVVTSHDALVSYKCTAEYHPECESTLRWDDPELGIEWPVRAPRVSARDQAGARLRELAPERLPGTVAVG